MMCLPTPRELVRERHKGDGLNYGLEEEEAAWLIADRRRMLAACLGVMDDAYRTLKASKSYKGKPFVEETIAHLAELIGRMDIGETT